MKWVAAAVLLAACAGAPRGHLGPVTGRAEFAGRVFSCSRAGLFEECAGGTQWLGDPGLRPFALAAGTPGLLVGGGEPAASGDLALCDPGGAVQARAQIADDLVYAVALSPDGATAAAACADGRIVLLAVPALAAARTRWTHDGPAVAVAFSPDGGRLASAGHDGVIALGAPPGDGAPLRLAEHTAAVLCLAWNADGSRLASGARDGKVRLHDRAGRLLRTWQRLGGEVRSVGFAAGGIAYEVCRPAGEPTRGRLDG